MDKPFDKELSKMSKNQLLIMRTLLAKPESIMTTREIAKKTAIVEKRLGGVLSAMSRKRVNEVPLIDIMGRDAVSGLRWKLNSKAITIAIAINKVRVLLLSYK